MTETMGPMGRRRYLLALLVALGEGAIIVGIDSVVRQRWMIAGACLALSAVFFAASVGGSAATRDYARTMFPNARPPVSWTVSFIVLGLLSLIGGAYFLLAATREDGVRIVTGPALGLLLLFVSSFLSIGCYHLWRDVPKNRRH